MPCAPGNPDNAHTILIPEEVVAAHLAEYELDYEGECYPVFACKEEDQNLLRDPAFVDEGGALERCGEVNDGENDRFAECIEEETGISVSCADCYGAFIRCSGKENLAKKCEKVCTSDKPEACDACIDKSRCQDTFSDCAGLGYPVPQPLQATFKEYKCDAGPAGCEWNNDYTLKPWKTK